MKKGFTLAELIVVITILSILSTIAFLSFSNYSAGSRDSMRISDISNLTLLIQTDLSNSSGSSLLNNKNVKETFISANNDIKCYSFREAYFCNFIRDKIFYAYTFLENENDKDINSDLISDNFYPYKSSISSKIKRRELIGTGGFVFDFDEYLVKDDTKVYFKKGIDTEENHVLMSLLIGEEINNAEHCIIMGYKQSEKGEYIYTNSNECDKNIVKSNIRVKFTSGKQQKNIDNTGKGLIITEVNEIEYNRANNIIKKQERIEKITYVGLGVGIISLIPLFLILCGVNISVSNIKKNKKKNLFFLFCIIVLILIGLFWIFIN